MSARKENIVCPKCRGAFVNRKGRRCRFCNVTLYFKGELMVDYSGYFWNGKRWISVQAWVDAHETTEAL